MAVRAGMHGKPDTMLYWLATVACRAREDAGRMPVHIGARMNRDPATVYQFERAARWPRDTDVTLAAYAHECDVPVAELWRRALKLFREHDVHAPIGELIARKA